MLRNRAPLIAGVVAAVILGGLLWSDRAEAFCRTTTCVDCVAPDTGCIQDGLPLYWTSSCVSYDVQEAGSKWADVPTITSIASTAFHAWTDATCPASTAGPSIHATDMGPVTCEFQQYNDDTHTFGGNANIIVFHDNDWTLTSSSDPASTLALTTVTFAVASGEIYDADIEVNGTKTISTSTPVPTSAYDLQSILTHEIGHFLGMAHSTEPCTSGSGGDCPTMNPYYTTGTDAYRSLEADDVAGICTIYPPSRQAGSSSCTPRHGFSSECGTTVRPPSATSGCSVAPGRLGAGGATAALLMAGLAVIRSRRRRARAPGLDLS
jgi:hypothetical protein